MQSARKAAEAPCRNPSKKQLNNTRLLSTEPGKKNNNNIHRLLDLQGHSGNFYTGLGPTDLLQLTNLCTKIFYFATTKNNSKIDAKGYPHKTETSVKLFTFLLIFPFHTFCFQNLDFIFFFEKGSYFQHIYISITKNIEFQKYLFINLFYCKNIYFNFLKNIILHLIRKKNHKFLPCIIKKDIFIRFNIFIILKLIFILLENKKSIFKIYLLILY